MSLEANKAVVRRYVGTRKEEFEADDWAVLDDVWSADCRIRLGSAELEGIGALKQLFGTFFSGFSGLEGRIDDLVAEGDKVAARFTWWGTHEGEFEGIAPTGKEVRVSGVGIYRIADGKIAEAWVQDDSLGLMRQIGAL